MQQSVRTDDKKQQRDDRRRHRQSGGGGVLRCNAKPSQNGDRIGNDDGNSNCDSDS